MINKLNIELEQIRETLSIAKEETEKYRRTNKYIESYRLIGYENKLLTEEEFEDDATDAGELGSGHTVTVCYEVKMTDKALSDGGNLAQVNIKYKPTEHSGGASEISKDCNLDIATTAYHASMTENDAFVASVIEFALLLRDSRYKGTANYPALISRLKSLNLSGDEFKTEFRSLVESYYKPIQAYE